MKSRGRWKISPGGHAVFAGYLLLLFSVELILRLLQRRPVNWTSWLMLGLLMLCGWALWKLVWNPLRVESRWRDPRAWSEGSFTLGALMLGYAAIVFIFGRTPSKYSSHPVPRSAGWFYVAVAAIPLAIGAVAWLRIKLSHRAGHPSRAAH